MSKHMPNRFGCPQTADQNLRYPQNLTGRQFAVLVLPTISWPKIQDCQTTPVRPARVVFACTVAGMVNDDYAFP